MAQWLRVMAERAPRETHPRGVVREGQAAWKPEKGHKCAPTFDVPPRFKTKAMAS